MKPFLIAAISTLLCFHAGAAAAAVPEFGTRDGELACVGLVGVGLTGASRSQPSYPNVVTAVAMAEGFYLGRLSKVDPNATKQDVDAAVAKLSLDEKNAYLGACLKQAAELMKPTLG
jgi:hypothetical protein